MFQGTSWNKTTKVRLDHVCDVTMLPWRHQCSELELHQRLRALGFSESNFARDSPGKVSTPNLLIVKELLQQLQVKEETLQKARRSSKYLETRIKVSNQQLTLLQETKTGLTLRGRSLSPGPARQAHKKRACLDEYQQQKQRNADLRGQIAQYLQRLASMASCQHTIRLYQYDFEQQVQRTANRLILALLQSSLNEMEDIATELRRTRERTKVARESGVQLLRSDEAGKLWQVSEQLARIERRHSVSS